MAAQVFESLESSILQARQHAGKSVAGRIHKVRKSMKDLGVVLKDAVSDIVKRIEELLQPKKEN